MLNFVICKENISSTDNYLSLINAFMMKYDYDYKINVFKAFDDTWQDFIRKEDGFKIYFNYYQIAPYYYGSSVITVPYNYINN